VAILPVFPTNVGTSPAVGAGLTGNSLTSIQMLLHGAYFKLRLKTAPLRNRS
jgi:hypothetical protein